MQESSSEAVSIHQTENQSNQNVELNNSESSNLESKSYFTPELDIKELDILNVTESDDHELINKPKFDEDNSLYNEKLFNKFENDITKIEDYFFPGNDDNNTYIKKSEFNEVIKNMTKSLFTDIKNSTDVNSTDVNSQKEIISKYVLIAKFLVEYLV